ncbi:MAG: hypothetical protein ORN57_05425 [Alphaproteobacteria bacterium]|nr:hypothetical protein [Alphaproteobacteria bacterium]
MMRILQDNLSWAGITSGLVAWLLAFGSGVIYMKVVGFTDRDTALNDKGLHILAFVVLVAVTAALYLYLKNSGNFNIAVPNSFFLVNVALDVVVLLVIMGFDVVKWVSFGLSGYLIIFYGLYYLIKH